MPRHPQSAHSPHLAWIPHTIPRFTAWDVPSSLRADPEALQNPEHVLEQRAGSVAQAPLRSCLVALQLGSYAHIRAPTAPVRAHRKLGLCGPAVGVGATLQHAAQALACVGRATGASQQSSVSCLCPLVLRCPPVPLHRCSILQCACV